MHTEVVTVGTDGFCVREDQLLFCILLKTLDVGTGGDGGGRRAGVPEPTGNIQRQRGTPRLTGKLGGEGRGGLLPRGVELAGLPLAARGGGARGGAGRGRLA